MMLSAWSRDWSDYKFYKISEVTPRRPALTSLSPPFDVHYLTLVALRAARHLLHPRQSQMLSPGPSPSALLFTAPPNDFLGFLLVFARPPGGVPLPPAALSASRFFDRGAFPLSPSPLPLPLPLPPLPPAPPELPPPPPAPAPPGAAAALAAAAAAAATAAVA